MIFSNIPGICSIVEVHWTTINFNIKEKFVPTDFVLPNDLNTICLIYIYVTYILVRSHPSQDSLQLHVCNLCCPHPDSNRSKDRLTLTSTFCSNQHVDTPDTNNKHNITKRTVYGLT